jgi:hypothetical protein
MMQYGVNERSRVKRQWVEQAIKLAMQSQWEEAVRLNRRILEAFPPDAETYNRLGKALSELGRVAEARQAYEAALQLDPRNTIARKNLERLKLLGEAQVAVDREEGVNPQLFIEETGKTGRTTLVRVGPPEALAKVAPADPVYLRPDGNSLKVVSAHGDVLGEVEPRLAVRLLKLMAGGNRYAAAITSIDPATNQVQIIIRETYQHPSQAGRVSFPTKAGAEADLRPYTREQRVPRFDILGYEEEEELGGLEEEEEEELEAEIEADETLAEPYFEEEDETQVDT